MSIFEKIEELRKELADIDSKIQLKEESIRRQEEELLNLQEEKETIEEKVQLVSEVEISMREEMQKDAQQASEALATLFMAFRTGGVTEADFVTFASSSGLEIPPELRQGDDVGGDTLHAVAT